MSVDATHVVKTREQEEVLIKLLNKTLPIGLGLKRRLQTQPRTSQTLILSTFVPDDEHVSALLAQGDQQYAIGRFDRGSPDLHGAILHSSLELHKGASDVEIQQVLALLVTFSRLRPLSDTESESDPNNEDVVLAGCTHANVASMLRDLGIARDDIRGPGGPYTKLVFELQTMKQHEEPPKGLTWDVVRTEDDFAAVTATNSIIRARSQIDGRKNAALRKTETATGNPELVGWAFLGLDGSTRTMYVRPEWRGKGLAKRIVRKLANDAANDDGLSHTDVAPDSKLACSLQDQTRF